MQRWQAWLRDIPVGGKLFLFTTGLLGIFLLLAITLVSTASYNFAAQRADDNLVVGQRVFSQVISQQQDTLHQAAQLLAADFGFRDALSSNDAETISSALLNQSLRINATLAVALDLNGHVIASTAPGEPRSAGTVFSTLVQRAQQKGDTGGLAFIDKKPLELIVVPVKAPLTIGWVVLGFELDDSSMRKIADLVSLDVSLLAQDKDGWHLYATSLNRSLYGVDAVARLAASTEPGRNSINLDGELYQLRVLPMMTVDGSRVVAVQQQSSEIAMKPYENLRLLLVALLLLSFIVAMAGSRWLARVLSRPLVQLTRKAEEISRGQYDQPLPVTGKDEIGQLATSVNAMSIAIAEREREIMHRAYYDALTQLPNRQMIALLGEQAIALAQREQRALALVSMDIERFQGINDALGYSIGDQVIRLVGDRLKDLMREADAVSRPGGNQFMALLHTKEVLNIADFHRRIEQAFSLPFEVEGNPVDVSLSLGVALYPEHGASMPELMRNAEIALSVAKRERHGIVCYSAGFEQTKLSHLSLLSDLKRAVEQDELVMFLQPKVNVLTGMISSAEALVRWRHPERGFVPPAEFIPFAEQSGRIGMVTRWILAKAMALTTQWSQDGSPLQISVNVSARDVLDERFPDALHGLLEQYPGQAQWIRLEITESGLMENAELALSILNRIRGHGFTLSIDDFGTGYSSLSYLKRMPVAELKIDRSFVAGSRAGTDAAVLLRSTIDLGHNLALSVVAEGVETIEEWTLLHELGCDYIQGYFASKPLAVDEFVQWCSREAPFRPLVA